MPEIINNPYGAADFHIQQLAHYGIKNGEVGTYPDSDTASFLSQGTTCVDIASLYPQSDKQASPRPSFERIKAIPRPGNRPERRELRSILKNSSEYNRQRASRAHRRQARSGAERVSFSPPSSEHHTRESTRASVSPASDEYQSPESTRSSKESWRSSISLLTVLKEARDTGNRVSSIFSLKRRSDVDDLDRSFKRLKVSTPQTGAGLRQEIKQRARAVADIMLADANKRQAYETNKQRIQEEQLEARYRQNPLERPEHEKEFIVARVKQEFAGITYSRLNGARDYDLLVADQASGGAIATTARLAGVSGMLELSAADRHQARVDAYHKNGELPPPSFGAEMTKTEKLAFGLSKTLDVFKSKDDDDDEMDFMDQAPVTQMECCRRCQQPTHTYLVKGLCQACQFLQARARRRMP